MTNAIVEGSINIEGNNALTTLDGIKTLGDLSDITIMDNPVLQDISSLNSVEVKHLTVLFMTLTFQDHQ